jgi:hypothetical protein
MEKLSNLDSHTLKKNEEFEYKEYRFFPAGFKESKAWRFEMIQSRSRDQDRQVAV